MRSTRAIIHLENLRFNIRTLKTTLDPQTKICMAVKADAYGHGAVAVSKVARDEGINSLGVATVEEGRELREAGFDCPILLFSLPGPEELDDLAFNDLAPILADRNLAMLLANTAQKHGRTIECHLKVDTGMGRIGCRPDEIDAILDVIRSCPLLRLAGVCTHFPISDTQDRRFTLGQIDILRDCVARIKSQGLDPGVVHAANSGAIIGCREALFDMVRPGIFLYGYYPSGEQERVLPCKPVMELRTKIVFLKRVERGSRLSYGLTYTTAQDTLIATLPVGYADGYSRLLSNKADVFIRGKRYPIAGRICMDQCLVDLGPDADVELYDDVVLFGPGVEAPGVEAPGVEAPGVEASLPAAPDAEEIAGLMNTIPYEVTCLIARRVPRIYTDSKG